MHTIIMQREMRQDDDDLITRDTAHIILKGCDLTVIVCPVAAMRTISSKAVHNIILAIYTTAFFIEFVLSPYFG